LSYHEHEFYADTDGDAVEIISKFGATTDDIHVWFAVYVDGAWATPYRWLGIAVSPGETVEYEFFLTYRYPGDPKGVVCYLKEPDGDWYGGVQLDSSPPTNYTLIFPSSETDTQGGITEEFAAATYPLITDGLEINNGYGWEQVNNYIAYFNKDEDEKYTDITDPDITGDPLNEQGLSSKHIVNNDDLCDGADCPPDWDISCDHICDSTDLTPIRTNWFTSGVLGWIRPDIDQSGQVNASDLNPIRRFWFCSW
jgi:hypothetical protein